MTIIEIKPVAIIPVKCCKCRDNHRIRNVCNGQYYCIKCWNKVYGPKR